MRLVRWGPEQYAQDRLCRVLSNMFESPCEAGVIAMMSAWLALQHISQCASWSGLCSRLPLYQPSCLGSVIAKS